ncbi:MAG: hypothetical protein P8R42_29770 [Candidatus Binatia bacterium]|nr:hypothetical protein [Candidatus Binatia bacterium]
MRERAAQAVLLARSFEEADPEGVLLSSEDRGSATEAGRAAGGTPDLQAERRAGALLVGLSEQVRALARVRSWTRVSLGLVAPVVLVSFLVGLSTNALGPTRHINLLAFPLLALVVWNVSVYGFVLVSGLVTVLRRPARRADGPTADGAAAADRGTGFLASVAWWVGEWTLERVRTPDPREADVVSRALAAYWSEWAHASLLLGFARLRAFLHLGAAALAVGVVAGMYIRGLGLEYRATWESTFLSSDAVAAILHLVLGPAAVLLGETLPDAAGLASMVAPEGSTPAAPWIHMWGLTTAGVVVGPRLLLAATQLVRSASLARSVSVDPLAGSFRALLVSERGADVRIDVLPYSYNPGTRQLETLRELLHDLFGLEARIDVLPQVAYGTELDAETFEPPPTCVVVVYGLVQSPEREVHARYLEQWMEKGGEPQVLALLDGSSWRERFGEGSGQREAERLRAWGRVMREIGVTALRVDLGKPLAQGTVERAESSLWPDASTARTTGGR